MIDKFFFIIYNSYFKNGAYKNDNPPFAVGLIFGLALFSLVFDLKIITYWIIDPAFLVRGGSKTSTTLQSLLCLFGIYIVFFYKKRYLSICTKYMNSEFLNSLIAKIIAFFTIVLLILSPLLIGLVKNKVTRGRWL
ncbi:MAG: hypothetical protein EOO86_09165 [Pedobacter sp.]|nr:MAG: hypothetical protein EOO86_09165 [Pedobacter sp.]